MDERFDRILGQSQLAGSLRVAGSALLRRVEAAELAKQIRLSFRGVLRLQTRPCVLQDGRSPAALEQQRLVSEFDDRLSNKLYDGIYGGKVLRVALR